MDIAAGFKEIATNPYFVVVASLASIFGLLLGITIIFPPKKRPFYIIKSFNLIRNFSSSIDNLDMKYKSYDDKGNIIHEEIETLTTSKILFWNGGRKTINKEDIATSAPIEVSARGNNIIYDIDIIKQSINNKACNIKLENNCIVFDFLEPSNGMVLEIIHSGTSNKDIFLKGYIKDSHFGGKIKRINSFWLELKFKYKLNKQKKTVSFYC